MSIATADATADTTADATATVSAANKTWIFKSFSVTPRKNTRGSLALLNDCCHRAGRCFLSVSQTKYENTN